MKVIDLHCDTVGEVQAGKDFLKGNLNGHVDIPRLRKGQSGMIVFAAFVSSVLTGEEAYKEAIELIEITKQTCQNHNDRLAFIESYAEAKNILNSDKIGIIPAIENGHAINNQIKNLEIFKMLGACYMTLTHSQNLDWAASSAENSCDFDGLTNFGVKVVHAMNELGMIIDVSHVHESTFWEVAKYSKKPFIASHSNTQALCPINRNLTDDQIKAIADAGGMIGINFFPGFLDAAYHYELVKHCGDLFDAFDKIEIKYMDDPIAKNRGLHQFYKDLQLRMNHVEVGIEKIIEHIDHIVNLVGSDYVGFGSDFDGIPDLPAVMTGCDSYRKIIEMLNDKYSDNNIVEKIAYKNFLRVLKENK